MTPCRALLILAVLVAHANGLAGGWQFDDWNVIVGDPRVQSLGAWWDSMPGIRPLLKLTYALNHASGAGVVGFHVVNIAILAAEALLAHVLLLRLARRLDMPEVAALVGALVFALHPVQTEAVTYLSGRSASLSGLLVLAVLVAWQPKGEGRGLAALLFAAAIAVKETAAVLPLAVVLWRLTADRLPMRRAVAGTGLLWAVAGAAAVAAAASPVYRHLLATSLETRSVLSNLLTQAEAVVFLSGHLARPDLLNADPALPEATGPTWAVLLVLAVAVLGIALVRRAPAVAFALLWFLLWLAPTNSLLPRLDVANDRQLHLALLGPAWLAGLAVAGLIHRPLGRQVAAVGLALLLGVATAQRNRVYADETTFWSDVAAKAPHNGRAHNNLGWAHLQACRTAEARQAFARALALDPADYRAAFNSRLAPPEHCP